MHIRPRYFVQVLGELIYWIGEDRIQFSSDQPSCSAFGQVFRFLFSVSVSC